MKALRNLLLALAVALAAAGCTHNNGDIGPLFGTWQFRSVRADGAEIDLAADGALRYSLVFQNRMARIITLLPRHDNAKVTGTFVHEGDTLFLNFGHTDPNPGSWLTYTPPTILHLVRGITPLSIDRLTNRDMRLHYVDSLGVTYSYELTKTY